MKKQLKKKKQHQNQPKTVIGVLATHDDDKKNEALVDLFNNLCTHKQHKEVLKNFSFVFTGGTFNRIILGKNPKIQPVSEETKKFLLKDCGVICLPSYLEGGVTVLAYLVAQRKISIIWPFWSTLTTHWLNPENLALMRLCDQWHAKKLMNKGSVEEWIEKEAERDACCNLQPRRLNLVLRGGNGESIQFVKKSETIRVRNTSGKVVEEVVKYLEVKRRPATAEFPKSTTEANNQERFDTMTIALIAHDEMKNRMAEFASDYETELGKFKAILATGTTGGLVSENAPTLKDKIYRYHSGPKGGDIEIATEILFGNCHVVIFFVDPLHPHPHIEDIRVVFGACMINDEVRMLSNEMQAREWMDNVVKGR